MAAPDDRPLWQRLGHPDPNPDPPNLLGTRGNHNLNHDRTKVDHNLDGNKNGEEDAQ